MRGISSLVLVGFLAFAAVCCARVDTPPQRANPNILLDATDTVHGIGGYADTRLLVRLTDDGKVEWDKWVSNNVKQRNASWIPQAEVMSIRQRLKTVDESKITREMGPYNIYVDTTAQLSIRMAARAGLITFSVINPWSSDLPRNALGKGRSIPPMPNDVESVVCEIEGLRGQISGDPMDPMCKAKDAIAN